MANHARNNKTRGRTFQNDVRDLILKTFPEIHPDDCKCAIMGESGMDIKLSRAAQQVLGGVSIECKRRKTLKTIYDWVKQAQSQGDYEPVVFTRADREKPLVIISADYYMRLLKGE